MRYHFPLLIIVFISVGFLKVTIAEKEDETSDYPVAPTSVSLSKTQEIISSKRNDSENNVNVSSVTEIANKDELPKSHTESTRNKSTFTKITNKTAELTITTTKVSVTNLSTKSSENTSEEHWQTSNETTTDIFTSVECDANTTCEGDTAKISQTSSGISVTNRNTAETTLGKTLQVTNETEIDNRTTTWFTTNTNSLIQSSSLSSSLISSESGTSRASRSTSERTPNTENTLGSTEPTEKTWKDPCVPNHCENGATCLAKNDSTENDDRFTCICQVGFTGTKCEKNQCDILNCDEDEYCVLEELRCKTKTSEDPIISTSTSLSTTQESVLSSSRRTNSESTLNGKTVTDISYSDELPNSSTESTNSRSPFTKTTNTITQSTTTMTKVSATDLSTKSGEKTNSGDHKVSNGTTSSPSIRTTSKFNKSSLTISSTTQAIVPSPENTSKDHRKTINGTTMDISTTVEYDANTTVEGDTAKTSQISSSTSVTNRSTTATDQLRSTTITDKTDRHTTNASSLFENSSQSSPLTSSEGSTYRTSRSTSKNTLITDKEITSEKPKTAIFRSTESKEKTQTVSSKPTTVFLLTTETSNSTNDEKGNSTNDANQTNASSQKITTYASLGTACFAALAAFAAGGWYIRRKCRMKQDRQLYRECDSSSENSINSCSSQNIP